MNDDPHQLKESMEAELKSYSKLEKINKSDEFNDFFDLQMDTAVQKMLSVFTGKGPANWEEFARVRGEVIGILVPIQQIRGAKFVKKKIQEQLTEYYNKEAVV